MYLNSLQQILKSQDILRIIVCNCKNWSNSSHLTAAPAWRQNPRITHSVFHVRIRTISVETVNNHYHEAIKVEPSCVHCAVLNSKTRSQCHNLLNKFYRAFESSCMHIDSPLNFHSICIVNMRSTVQKSHIDFQTRIGICTLLCVVNFIHSLLEKEWLYV